MASEAFHRIIKNIPLRIRLFVTLHAHFISKNCDANTDWKDEDGKIIKERLEYWQGYSGQQAKELLPEILETVEQWIEDGMPDGDKKDGSK